eukprot:Skav218310  [mRNA]  locus=scaffold2388:236159:236608:+ [translate_table: standard]
MGFFSQLQSFIEPIVATQPGRRHGTVATFLEAPAARSSFHNYTSHPTQGYYARPNEPCRVHRDFLREVYGPAIGPEHYCVNQNAQSDFKASKGFEPTQKCYDLQNCQTTQGRTWHQGNQGRPVLPTDPDYPNTVIFLTSEANNSALGMK